MLLFLPVLTGLLLVASFPLMDQGYLAWVAFAPLIAFVSQTKNRKGAFGGGFAAAGVALSILLIWIPGVLSHYGGMSTALAWIAYGLMVAMLACYPALACVLAKHWILRGGKSFILLFPFIWIVFEYALSISPFGGFPWLLTGYSQSRWLNLIQIVDVTGIYGVSFLILMVNASVAWILLRRSFRFADWTPLLAAGLLLAACLLYGRMSLHRWENTHPRFQVAMLQANLSVDDPEQVQIARFRNDYVRMAKNLEAAPFDLLILPETPTPVLFQSDPVYRNDLQILSARFPLGLIFSNINYREEEGEERYSNSAFFLDRNGKLTGIYDKMHLVPFGEYIPLKKLFFFSESIIKDVGEFYPGNDPKIVKIGDRPSHAIICFEAVFPDLMRRFVNAGSQLIVNLTNDGWYGDSAAPYQHLAITRLRAVENRRFLLRATNSGVSAIIEPSGRIQSSTGILREAICTGHFAFLNEVTFYTRYGDVFVFLCAIISCGAWILIEVRRALERSTHFRSRTR
jgi:apolipoprotein N-acyltransferase